MGNKEGVSPQNLKIRLRPPPQYFKEQNEKLLETATSIGRLTQFLKYILCFI